jgi:hypothetical protein
MSLWRKRNVKHNEQKHVNLSNPLDRLHEENVRLGLYEDAYDLSIKSDDLSIKLEKAMREVQKLGQEIEKNEILEQNNQRIETLYALYQQASSHRDILMAQQKEMILKIRDANEIIFKSCVNLPHWKRTAMRYLKHNVPQAHQQAVNEFNEHPDGRGQA